MKVATVTPEEFIRRFLQHVLPKGFHKVRSYGLLAPSYKTRLERLQIQLAACSTGKEHDCEPDNAANEKPAYGYCPNCKEGRLVPVLRLPPNRRAPP